MLDLLKFYWAEKLNLAMNQEYVGEDPNMKQESSIEYKKKKISLLYDYISDKQRQILFMLNWKLQIVSVVHFLDHYKRLLPELSKIRISVNQESFATPK